MAKANPERHDRDEFPPAVREAAFRDNMRRSPTPGCYWCEWCFFCHHDRRYFQLDHIVAAIRGGPGTPANAIVLCEGCNKSKRERNEPGLGAFAYRFSALNRAPANLQEKLIPEAERQRLIRLRRREGAFVFPSVRFQPNAPHRAK